MQGDVVMGPVSTKTWVRGSLVTFDGEANAGYLTVCLDPNQPGHEGQGGCCHAGVHTVELAAGVQVDIDGEGSIIGVETLGHEVGIADLLLALRWYQGDPHDEGGGEGQHGE